MEQKFEDMDDETKVRVIKAIDELKTDVAFFIRNRRSFVSSKRDNFPQSHFIHAMALMLLASHEIMHDNAEYTDFFAIAQSAWDKSVEIHKKCKK